MQNVNSFLRNVPLFKAFNDDHIANLAKLVKLQSFGGEEIIFNQEDKGDALFIIQLRFRSLVRQEKKLFFLS